jgi:hypothetical protein
MKFGLLSAYIIIIAVNNCDNFRSIEYESKSCFIDTAKRSSLTDRFEIHSAKKNKMNI